MCENVNIPLQKLEAPWPSDQGVQTFLARLDAFHPHYGGNKWFKLKYNLERAKSEGYKQIITFGGAYSNHLRAAAAAAKDFGIDLVAVVRGEGVEPLNDVLKFVESQGGTMHFVSRELYRQKEKPSFIQQLLKQLGDAYVIPEGGANAEGIFGSTEIVKSLSTDFDYVVCACGTFTTLTGLLLALANHQEAVGINVLKAPGYGYRQVTKLIKETIATYPNLQHSQGKTIVIDDYHFGGYAKKTNALVAYQNWLKQNLSIETDFVYTAKLLYAMDDLIRKHYFKPNSKIIVLYTNTTTSGASID